MSSEGSSYARFRRALTTGNLALVRAAARELPSVGLGDALEMCLLIQHGDPERYEQAAIRWLGRLCLEHREIGFDDLAQGLAAFHSLPLHPGPARQALIELCRRCDLHDAARALA